MAFCIASLKFMVEDLSRRNVRPSGHLLTLSRSHIMFSGAEFNRVLKSYDWNIEIKEDNLRYSLLNDETVFQALGFDSLNSIDNSDYQGATIIHDLNNTDIPEELLGKYDYIIDIGTIEHVFHLPNVFENIHKLLKEGGTFIFNQPVIYGLNHGYHNSSPCLYYDYFRANNYDINALIPYIRCDNNYYVFDPIINDVRFANPFISVNNSVTLVWGSVNKTAKSTFDVIPNQGVYNNIWETSPFTKICRVLEDADNSSVYLYGTGNYVKNILQLLPNRYICKIAGLLSKESEEIGQTLWGICRVYAIEDIMDKSNISIVIATSEFFQNIVYDRIKHLQDNNIQIVRLYN